MDTSDTCGLEVNLWVGPAGSSDGRKRQGQGLLLPLKLLIVFGLQIQSQGLRESSRSMALPKGGRRKHKK